MPRNRKAQMTRRAFVQGSAAAVGIAAGIAVDARPPQGFSDPPPFPVDETQESEVLVCTRDIPTSRWSDGDVVQAYSTHDALRVHAETLANGRSRYHGEALPALRVLYDQITDNRRRPPRPEDLRFWWSQAKALAGLRSADFSRYPFTPLERRRLLVVPLEADVTPAVRQIVGGGRVFRHWKLTVDWRSALVGPGLGTPSDVLDPSVEVTFRRPCPLSHVVAELVDVPASQEG